MSAEVADAFSRLTTCDPPTDAGPVAPAASRAPRNPDNNPLHILETMKSRHGRPAFVAGPMVRYTKLPFRELVRAYDTDIVYTPMILAKEFVRNNNARITDFSTNDKDSPVIVQVGVNNVEDLMKFVAMIYPFVDAIGINCGCPIRDQVRAGIGAALMLKPDLVASMVKAVKDKYGNSVCIETKIRIHNDLLETLEFVKKVEASGVDFITVHGRTKNTRSSIPVDLEAIKLVKATTSVPVVANGDCFSLEDAMRIAEYTGADGVMSARGILSNPALFAGFSHTPWAAIELFFDLVLRYGLPFRVAQHHLSEMLNKVIPKKIVRQMNETNGMVEMIDWFDDLFVLKRRDEEGFATLVNPPWRVNPDEARLNVRMPA